MSGQTVESTLVGDNKGPANITLKTALPFWREALPKMPLGAKWELYVHPKLAYGERGTEKVPANELLIYTAEPGSPSAERLRLLASWSTQQVIEASP